MLANTLQERYLAVRAEVEKEALKVGRSPQSIRLLAVSKFHPQEAIAELLMLGQHDFGENYVQEAKAKVQYFQTRGEAKPTLHCIGHLQRNKVKDAVSIFDCIHTVDRESLAREIAIAAEKQGKKQRILLQMKVSEEEAKSGCQEKELPHLFEVCQSLPQLEVRGLMCIGRFSEMGVSLDERRGEFQQLARMREQLQERYSCQLPELSMGMSEDFALAIAEGSTMVRVGTAIFGSRPVPV